MNIIEKLQQMKFKIIILSLYCAILFSGQVFAIDLYQDNVDFKVDSLFQSNFKRMEKTITGEKSQDDNSVDRAFVSLLTYFSGVECSASDYSGFCHFDKEKLTLWEEWYKKNKSEIEWGVVENALKILKKPYPSEDEYEFLENLNKRNIN